jgi:hypothetical protein
MSSKLAALMTRGPVRQGHPEAMHPVSREGAAVPDPHLSLVRPVDPRARGRCAVRARQELALALCR